jgi:hypothetical protein
MQAPSPQRFTDQKTQIGFGNLMARVTGLELVENTMSFNNISRVPKEEVLHIRLQESTQNTHHAGAHAYAGACLTPKRDCFRG